MQWSKMRKGEGKGEREKEEKSKELEQEGCHGHDETVFKNSI